MRSCSRLTPLVALAALGCATADTPDTTDAAPPFDSVVIDAEIGADAAFDAAGCEATTEVCNGLDDDCDDAVDEDLTAPACALTEGVCVGATARCGGAEGWLACDATDYGADYEASESRCDALNNDCDLETDEGCACVVGSTQLCGATDVGECALGEQECLEGGTWGSCVGDVGPTGESCNGLDDDCDGATDDSLTPPACPLQDGVCAGSVRTCDGAAGWLPCSGPASYGADYEASETLCDGLDNDCDLAIDEGCTCVDGDTQPCGSDTGACVSGLQTCDSGAWGACAGEVTPVAETCDGVDQDCDSAIDDGLTGALCPLQDGVCAGARQTCGGAAGWLACAGTASYGALYQTTESTCDGLDNDCDLEVDETCACTVGDTQPCGSTTGACEPGTQTCTATGWGACTGGVAATAELCNGVDDDCNGTTDDGLTPPACTLTQGVCAGATAVCGGAAGWVPCAGTASYGALYVATEDGATHEDVCDGLDNDCDGAIDDGCLSGPLVAGAGDTVQPAIYDQLIAFLAHDGTSHDVYVADLRSGAVTRLTTTTADETAPDIYGPVVVYGRGTGAAARVVVYRLATGVETVLTTSESTSPRISSNLVAWQDRRAGTWDIYLYDLAAATEYAYLTTAANETAPDLRGATLAYLSDATGTPLVHVVDLSLGATSDTVQNAAGARQGQPMADWFHVGWSDGRNAAAPWDETVNWEAYSADTSALATESVLSVATGAQWLTDADGTVFVWNDYRNGNGDVGVGVVGASDALFTSGAASQVNPAIHGNVVVWQDNRLGDFDIYASTFGGVPATTAGWLKINEVLADPGAADDVNGDGVANTTSDEFIEIVNAVNVALDIGDCTINDGYTLRHTFAPGTVVPSGGAIVVFGGGTPAALCGGVKVVTASSGALQLNNTGGETVTLTCAGTVIDQMTYTTSPADQSLVRWPEFSGLFANHSVVAGARFSPGTFTDSYGF